MYIMHNSYLLEFINYVDDNPCENINLSNIQLHEK